MTTVSYAQNYEDIMLMRALGGLERGFYVDVGAQDPVDDSVTKAFYERGWHGVNIEPVLRWHEHLCADRPRDANLRMLAGEHAGSVDFYEVVDTGLSTTDPALAHQYGRDGREVVRHRIECATLDSILERYAEEDIHFLKIDVEGAEAAVLRGLSLRRFRPWLLVIESHAPNSEVETHDAWEGGVLAAGYRLAYQDGLNRFYVADERASLASAFASPPNVLDDFIRYGEWRVRHELQREKIAGADQLRRIGILEASVAQRDDQVSQWRERAAGLSAQAEALQRAESELAMVLRSRSWRITRPLRVIVRLVRNGPDEVISTIGKRIRPGRMREMLRALLGLAGLRPRLAVPDAPAVPAHAAEEVPPAILPESRSSRTERALAAMDATRGDSADPERQ